MWLFHRFRERNFLWEPSCAAEARHCLDPRNRGLDFGHCFLLHLYRIDVCDRCKVIVSGVLVSVNKIKSAMYGYVHVDVTTFRIAL